MLRNGHTIVHSYPWPERRRSGELGTRKKMNTANVLVCCIKLSWTHFIILTMSQGSIKSTDMQIKREYNQIKSISKSTCSNSQYWHFFLLQRFCADVENSIAKDIRNNSYGINIFSNYRKNWITTSLSYLQLLCNFITFYIQCFSRWLIFESLWETLSIGCVFLFQTRLI